MSLDVVEFSKTIIGGKLQGVEINGASDLFQSTFLSCRWTRD
jgi:hypothetical protein